ncbi:unnamed protein product [Microthlaspi erraticum]|uniref:DUF4283 domain-containing protein n=1 Tax=Microthlaspi erraticum TaxID=1685480 RepID=A0A6D2IP65_9BRAS|nr:unnamed protein product [Microthlaspi erraticum]CAA7028388.1 unnamed protein product [Microthlaspi erraticum]
MERRFSYAEKGKAVVTSQETAVRKRIRAPNMDTTDLIEENSLTLIGRVTNPREQRIRSLIPYFTNRWEIKGEIEGSDLGNNCFQFRFTLLEDLKRILANRPYQFSRWMVVLQRWEPIISANFPSQIPFWIKLKGLPLHYWKEDLVCKIGREAGELLHFEISKTVARTKISVNALNPILKETEVEFATGEVALVTLEYERLGLHCTICNSLTHEDKYCPEPREQQRQRSSSNNRPRSPAGEKHQDKGARPPLDTQRRTTRGEGEPNRKEKRDRHGNLIMIMEKPVYTNQGKEHRVETTREVREETPLSSYRESFRTPQRSGGSSPTKRRDYREYLDRATRGTDNANRYYREEERWYQGARRGQVTRRSPPQLQWREKGGSRTPSHQGESGRSETSRPQSVDRRMEDRNPPEIPIPTTEEVMQELQEVTIRYINCPDPAESAARRQRVMLSEEQGLMEETAANIIAAATESYQRTLNFEQEQEDEEVLEPRQQQDQNIPATQDLQRKRRGRPPKNKRASPAVGVSLRQRNLTQCLNSPQVRDSARRNTKTRTQRGNQRCTTPINQRDAGPSTERANSETNLPALSRATENLRSPQDRLP